MSRSYLRLDPDFAERKRAYPDGPYRALIDVFCAAEYEPKRGCFRNMAILRAVIGKSARHLPYLFAKRDIVLTADDRIQVVGWEEWQEGNWQVIERMRRVRERREGVPTVTTALSAPDEPGVTTPPSASDEPRVTVPSERLAVSGKRLAVGGGSAPPTARPPILVVIDYLEERTGRLYSFGNGSKVHESLSADVRDFGSLRVIAEMKADSTAKPDIGQLVFGAANRLHPIAKAPTIARPDDSAERFDRGVAATQRMLARQRGETA